MFPVFNIGPLSVPAPAFILIIGFLLGSYLLEKKASSYSVDSEILDRALWIGTLSTLLGARLSYIAGSPASFKGNLISLISLNPALLDPVAGFVIGISAVMLIISRQKTMYWKFLDSFTPFIGSLLPAYYLSRFASGTAYGLPTDLPWGIYLWGAARHPVQIYLTISAIILLTIILIYTPSRNLPSGSTFLLFSAASSSFLLFFTAFQEPTIFLIAGIRIEMIIFWIILFVALFLLNSRIQSTIPEVNDEAKK
jgi:phosphatidylglycerol---prolipoprotein diacylglyceryl transferase